MDLCRQQGCTVDLSLPEFKASAPAAMAVTSEANQPMNMASCSEHLLGTVLASCSQSHVMTADVLVHACNYSV